MVTRAWATKLTSAAATYTTEFENKESTSQTACTFRIR